MEPTALLAQPPGPLQPPGLSSRAGPGLLSTGSPPDTAGPVRRFDERTSRTALPRPGARAGRGLAVAPGAGEAAIAAVLQHAAARVTGPFPGERKLHTDHLAGQVAGPEAERVVAGHLVARA